MDDLADVRAFSFTELRVEQCIRLVAAGKVKTKSDSRSYWRDSGSPHGLHLLASAKGGTCPCPRDEAEPKPSNPDPDVRAGRLLAAFPIPTILNDGERPPME